MKLRNLIQNPSFEMNLNWWTVAGGSAGASTSANFVNMWGGSGSGSRLALLTAEGTSTLMALQMPSSSRIPAAPGEWVALALLVASDSLGTNPSRGIQAAIRAYDANGVALATAVDPYTQSPWYEGRRIIMSALMPPGTVDYMVFFRGYSGTASVNIASGQRLWADSVISAVASTEDEARAAVRTYFDGDTPDTPLARYEWDGVPHASTSTATITTIDAHLLTGDDPAPVQIVVQDLAPGSEYEIRGHRAGFSWSVPGGIGTSDGSQIVLIDNRAPLNAPVTYTLTVDGASVSTEPLTVRSPGRYLIQSLDGRTKARFGWVPDGLPRNYAINMVTYDVPGRRRPPARYAQGGAGGGSLTIRTDRENTRRIENMIYSGRPLIIRTDGQMLDLDPVETLMLNQTGNRLWAPTGGDPDHQRDWALTYTLIDDPEPNVVVSAYTWADFNQIYAGQTWADFNAEWAGETWADFNAYDWGQQLP